jgi:hypothetical protein
MTSLPPPAAGLPGDPALAPPSTAAEPAQITPSQASLPAAAHNQTLPYGARRDADGRPAGAPEYTPSNGVPGRAAHVWEPRTPLVKPSAAAVELTLDLRGTPPDKVLSRLFGALERVSDDVTLIVLLRDTPEFVGVVSSVFQALRQRGYWSDTSRYPAGVQRLRTGRRQVRPARRSPAPAARDDEPAYAPAPLAPAGDGPADGGPSDGGPAGDGLSDDELAG